MRLFRNVPLGGSAVLAVTTFASYAMGLVRDRTFAQTFGASRDLDAYNAAFLLPDFLFNVFVASGIAAAVVPLFTGLQHEDRLRAKTYINTILTTAVAAMAFSAVVVILFAGPASALVAPGFSSEDRATTTHLLRLLALSPILFAASNAIGAALVAEQRFLYYGLSPVFYNAGIIFGALTLAPRFGITGVAAGTLLGALLHLAIRLWGIRPLRLLRYKPTWQWTAEIRQTLRLMIPKMIGHPVELATFWVFTAIASHLAPGSIAVLNFARNFQSVPVAIIGIAVGTAAFPLLSQAAADRSSERFRRVLVPSFGLILGVSTAAAVVLYALREPLLALLLGGGAFGPEAIARTAATLAIFALAVPTEALSQLAARAFYATKNTTIPVACSIVSFVIAAGSAWVLAPTFDLLALPIAFALGSAGKLVLLLAFLPRRLRRL